MNPEKATKFVEDWINSWNEHDLEGILSHYADSLQFYSPFIKLLNFNDTGVIESKDDLRKYFTIGLTTYPDLKFILNNFLVGIHSIVINYISVNGRQAAEVFELNDEGQAIKVYCHYTLS